MGSMQNYGTNASQKWIVTAKMRIITTMFRALFNTFTSHCRKKGENKTKQMISAPESLHLKTRDGYVQKGEDVETV